MEKISYRELQRMSSDKLLEILPCGVAVDSQGIAIVLSIEGYKRLIEGYKGNKQNDSQPIPLYNPAIHRAGDRVLVKPGKSKKLVEVVIPEVDADGNAVPSLT